MDVNGENDTFDLNFKLADLYDEEKEKYDALSAVRNGKPQPDNKNLRAILLRRAVSNIHNIIKAQKEGPRIQNIRRANMCPDLLWNSYNNAVRELNQEIKDMQADADEIKPGWGEQIIPQAQSIVQLEMKRKMEHMKAAQQAKQQQAQNQNNQQQAQNNQQNQKTKSIRPKNPKQYALQQKLREKLNKKKHGNDMNNDKKISSHNSAKEANKNYKQLLAKAQQEEQRNKKKKIKI